MGSREDLTGQKFGRLSVAGFYAREGGKRLWSCNCDCGTACVIVPTGKLKEGLKLSCGCLQREVASKRLRTHGQSRTPEHRAWNGMRARCLNPSASGYADYGGRGIVVCERWLTSFEAFFDDMGRKPSARHSLERIDVNGNYEPGNCCWATRKEQARNTRTTKWLSVDGVVASLAEHCEKRGLRYGTVLWRLRAGMSPEMALSVPNLYRAKLKALKEAA